MKTAIEVSIPDDCECTAQEYLEFNGIDGCEFHILDQAAPLAVEAVDIQHLSKTIFDYMRPAESLGVFIRKEGSHFVAWCTEEPQPASAVPQAVSDDLMQRVIARLEKAQIFDLVKELRAATPPEAKVQVGE